MESSKSVGTPMTPSCKLDKDEYGKNVDSKLYRGMIDSLLYLTTSRHDIMFSICMCARYQSNPKEYHLNAVKKNFRYLKKIQNLGLWFSKQSSMDLISFSYANFARCKLDRKSTSGTYQFLGVNLIF